MAAASWQLLAITSQKPVSGQSFLYCFLSSIFGTRLPFTAQQCSGVPGSMLGQRFERKNPDKQCVVNRFVTA